MSIVFLNGEYLPVEEARVSVLDRGFTFADAVYEVIPVYGEHIFRLPEHLQRLDNSLREIYISNPHSTTEWRNIFSKILVKNALKSDRSLYVQVSRGVSERDFLHVDDLKATVFIMCRPILKTDLATGVSAITHEDIRWKYCHIKATTLLANVLLKQRARLADGSVETILVKDGYITEGASSNVFIVKDGTVLTPEKDGSVLPGITRDLVVELLQHAGIPCLERSITLEALKTADEVWITSSTMGIAPVIRIDGSAVAEGKSGNLWTKINKLFQEFKRNPTGLQ